MGLKTMSLLAGATVSSTGGTAQAFTPDGVNVSNGLHLVVAADTDYTTRRQLTAKYRPPAIQKSGAFGKDKKSLTYVKPTVLTDGTIVFNTIRIEREVHPSLPAIDCIELNKIGAQLLADIDLDSFWSVGSLE